MFIPITSYTYFTFNIPTLYNISKYSPYFLNVLLWYRLYASRQVTRSSHCVAGCSWSWACSTGAPTRCCPAIPGTPPGRPAVAPSRLSSAKCYLPSEREGRPPSPPPPPRRLSRQGGNGTRQKESLVRHF